MPIYQYRCEHCGEELEKMQKLADAPLVECPACGQPALKKVISPVGFRLKGGGWYETDFKTGGKKNLHDSADKPAASGSGGAKADAAKPTESAAKPAETKSPSNSAAA